MKCTDCGFDNPDGFAFCGKCGTRLAPGGPSQALVNDADLAQLRRYFSSSQLDALPPAPLWRESDVVSTLDYMTRLLGIVSTYLPRYLVQTELAPFQTIDAVKTRSPFGGEFLNGALLIADISGSTAVFEQLSTLGWEGAEQVTEIVNRYFGAMLEVLFAYGGDLWKFGGDALLAFFPDEGPHAPGSLNALCASWAMQQALSIFHKVETSLGTFPLRIKIGLNAGPVFAARVGTAVERQFMVTGSTVNGAARAESLAAAGQILVSPTVFQQVTAAHPAHGVHIQNAQRTFEFSPGPSKHLVVEQLVSTAPPIQASTRPSTTTVHQPGDAPVDTLRRTLAALDRLTPYLPAGLLARLVSDPSRREVSSDYRLVSILFANLLGASALIDRLGPTCSDEIVLALNRYYVTMQQAISRYDGIVNKIDVYDHGDKLMALFGAPIAHEDDAERAVRAALDMQAAMREAGPMLISQRIGISTGVVFAGHVGSAERHEYTVMGDEVNLAARLMSAAAENELLLSSYVHRKVNPFFETADRGEVSLKGKSRPVPTYTIIKRRAQPEPVRGVQGLRSPLVGRAREVAVIRDLLNALCTGRGRILSLIGETGLGKSRLLAEWRAEASACGEYTWLEGHCLSYTQNVSYSAFAQIIRDALGILEIDNEYDMWVKLRCRVDGLLSGETGEDILPYLALFLSLPLSGPMAERVKYLEGEALQRQVIRGVSSLLERMAAQRPLVLIFEDLHWADSATLALLERCLAITDRAPVLICLIYRPDRDRDCWALGQTAARNYPHRYTEIVLRPLDTQAGEDRQMVYNLLSLEELPRALAQLIARAEGNPLYIEEIIRALIDTSTIARADSHTGQSSGSGWQVVREIDLQTVPHTLQGIIMTHIDRLSEETRRILQLASVVGRTFHYHMLAGLATATALAAHLEASLASLQRAGLIREQARTPDLEYGFTQILFRDVAYTSLSARDRKMYHWLVGQQLEEIITGQKREEIYELLAHHYSLSDDRQKALTYLIKAGDKTRLAYANREAITFYRQADALAAQLGRPQEQAAIAEGLGDVLFHVGEYDESLATFRRALQLETPEVLPRQADLHRRIGAIHEKRGEYDQALASCAQGIKLLSPDYEQAVEMARLLTLRSRVYRQQGQGEIAILEGELSLSILEETSNYRDIAEAHNILGRAHNALGHVDQAVFHFEQGLAILERIGDEYGASKIYNNLAIIYYQTDLARSATYFERVLQTMRRFGNVGEEAGAYQNLGITYYARGDYVRAIEHYQRSLEIWTRLGNSNDIADCYINLGEAHRAQSNPAQAIVHLEKGLLLAQQIGASQTETECHRQLAECYLEINQPDRALAACQEALEHAQKIGDRKEEGIIFRVLGKAHLQLHDPNSAVTCLEHGTAILRELNREFDLSTALYDYAEALSDSGQAALARERLVEALAFFERLQLPQEQAKVQAALDRIAQVMSLQ
jgi:class 3 adenylate cyclase/tetratricopeptide (TPR) repeat protein